MVKNKYKIWREERNRQLQYSKNTKNMRVCACIYVKYFEYASYIYKKF